MGRCLPLAALMGLAGACAYAQAPAPATEPSGADAMATPRAVAADYVVFANGFELGDIVLPFGSIDRTLPVQFAPVDPRADIVVSIDTTGSMAGEISNVRNTIVNTIGAARVLVPDTEFAVADWRDFPLAPFGNSGDSPWVLRQPMTASIPAVLTAMGVLSAAGGNDLPESGYEALFQLGTGLGIAWTGGSVPAYTGTGLGGVGFRPGSMRVVFHVTDASAHASTDYGAAIPGAHGKDEAFAALAALGIRVVPILSVVGTADTQIANTQLIEATAATGAEVLPCAFDHGPACAATQCCTAINGAGESPAISGRCPLRFRIDSTGAGGGTAIDAGVRALVKYGTHQLIASAADDGLPGTIDTTCFIDRIEADAFIPPPREPEASCVGLATPVAIGGSGYDNGFANVATGSAAGVPGTALQFIVHAGNDCAPSTTEAQVFVVYLRLTDTATGELMAVRSLSVVVPASP